MYQNFQVKQLGHWAFITLRNTLYELYEVSGRFRYATDSYAENGRRIHGIGSSSARAWVSYLMTVIQAFMVSVLHNFLSVCKLDWFYLVSESVSEWFTAW